MGTIRIIYVFCFAMGLATSFIAYFNLFEDTIAILLSAEQNFENELVL